jgi:type II secretory pathway pseudopilin PulG
MRLKSTRSAAVLSLLLSALMLVACSGTDTVTREEQEKQSVESFRDTIRNVIQDSDRQEEIIGLVETYQLNFKSLRNTIEAQRTEVRTLNADYEATREQFQILIDKYGAAISAARNKATDSRMAFVRATTAEEWAGLKKADAQAMKNMISTTQQI